MCLVQNSRPQLVDALGRNVTPRPLVAVKDPAAAGGTGLTAGGLGLGGANGGESSGMQTPGGGVSVRPVTAAPGTAAALGFTRRLPGQTAPAAAGSGGSVTAGAGNASLALAARLRYLTGGIFGAKLRGGANDDDDGSSDDEESGTTAFTAAAGGAFIGGSDGLAGGKGIAVLRMALGTEGGEVHEASEDSDDSDDSDKEEPTVIIAGQAVEAATGMDSDDEDGSEGSDGGDEGKEGDSGSDSGSEEATPKAAPVPMRLQQQSKVLIEIPPGPGAEAVLAYYRRRAFGSKKKKLPCIITPLEAGNRPHTDFIRSGPVSRLNNVVPVPPPGMPPVRNVQLPLQRLTAEELNEPVAIALGETDTEILFALPSRVVQVDALASKAAKAANARYEQVCATIQRSGPDLYPSKGLDSAPLAPTYRTRDTLASRVRTAAVGVQATTWDIADTQRKLRDGLLLLTPDGIGLDGEAALAMGASLSSSSASAALSPAAARSSTGAGAGRGKGGAGGDAFSSMSVAPNLYALSQAVDSVVALSLAAPGGLVDADGCVRLIPPHLLETAAQTKAAGQKAQKAAANAADAAAAAAAAADSGSDNDRKEAEDEPQEQAKDTAAVTHDGGIGALLQGLLQTGSNSSGNAKSSNSDSYPLTGINGPVDLLATVRQAERVLNSRSLLSSLALVERAVQQNLYHGKHRKYRALGGAEAIEAFLKAGADGGLKGFEKAAQLVAMEQAAGDALMSGRALYGGAPGGGAAAAASADAIGGDAGAASGVPPAVLQRRRSSRGSNRVRGSSNSKVPGDDDDAFDEDGGDSSRPGSRGASAGGRRSSKTGNVSYDPNEPRQATSAHLQRLWSYWCPMVDGLNVSCMAWNPRAKDLLAVGYGPYDFQETSEASKLATEGVVFHGVRFPPLLTGTATRTGGMIALWAMSNPTYPQGILRTPDGVGVTALDFSPRNPRFLAAGLEDGTVCVFDIRPVLSGDVPEGKVGLVSDRLQAGAHTEAVWAVKWVTKADTGAEVLVSISTDGRVTQWDCKKGMVPSLLMTLKRAKGVGVGGSASSSGSSAAASGDSSAPSGGDKTSGDPSSPRAQPGGTSGAGANAGGSGESSGALGSGGAEGLLSRTASGLAMDVFLPDTSQYFVGTEDGLLARCSSSYTEQYLDTVQAHAGPVYRVRSSPFIPSALLTCSADWSIRLWSASHNASASAAGTPPPVTTYSHDDVHDAIVDVAWSPAVSTLFSSVSRDGYIQLWDATQLSPIVHHISRVESDKWAGLLAEITRCRKKARDAAIKAEAKRRRKELGMDEEEVGSDDEQRDASGGDGWDAGSRPGTAASAHSEPADDAAVFGDLSQSPIAPYLELPMRPPPKKLSCVLFADNTNIIVVGDATGRVDVFRVGGLEKLMDTGGGATGGASSAGGGLDGAVARAAGVGDGSEEHEAQLQALQAALNSMVASQTGSGSDHGNGGGPTAALPSGGR
jgi:WD40 repeat protein